MRRLLIIGCGDVALRTVPQLRNRYRIYALTHGLERLPLLRANGVVPVAGDLDNAASLEGLAGIAHDVLHCAPPPRRGTRDTRTAHLIAALAKGQSLPQQLVYISTSGVYGDCAGDLVDDRFGLPRPQRVSRAEANRRVPPGLLSFMNESRRLSNRRIKRELRFALRYPTVYDGVAAGAAAALPAESC